MPPVVGCPLCEGPGGLLLAQDDRLRIIRASEPGFPGFYRVVWTRHAAELSDLSREEREHCMETVVRVEQAVRRHLAPDKVNLAALGNQVPHLHWHVVARFRWDSRFPASVWSPALRPDPPERLQVIEALLPALDAELGSILQAHRG